MSDAATWGRLAAALALLAVDPVGLRGLWLRGRASPMRDRATAAFAALPLPLVRVHPAIGDDALYGGIDIAATLAGHGVYRRLGLLAAPAALVLAMAERCPPGLAARLGAALDNGGTCLLAVDEGAQPEEALPAALADRLAFHIALDGLQWADTADIAPDRATLDAARLLLPSVTTPPDARADLTRVAERLGIGSLRAPLLALRAARAQAALSSRRMVSSDDLALAVELVFAPRATIIPADLQPESDPDPEPETTEEQPEVEGQEQEMALPEDILLDAVRALLPPDLLDRLAMGKSARAAKTGAGAGAGIKGNRRGRPLPSRPGRLGSAERIDLVATLRAAAPWQALRRNSAPVARLLHIRPDDIRLRRYEEKSDRLLIFTVDASGSAAFTRLNEAKGAVELLLAEAYVRRDHVALVSFRGTTAELLLPPTRSLVQTRHRLSALPGGGGTPLAAGLKAAMDVALQARARGMTPTIALLTDGRANIALDGTANRSLAATDAASLARALRVQGTPALVIDMGVRAEAALRSLAETMGAPYLTLPRADAARLSAAVSAALED